MPDFFSVLAPPWFWLCLGFVLLALELASTSAFFLCVSSAAFLLAGLTFAVPGLPWLWTFSLFALLLISASWVWWRFLYRRSGDARGNLLNARDRRIIGTVAVLSEDSSGLSGRLRIADATWPYVCDRPLKKGEVVVVREARGLILHVSPKEEDGAVARSC